MSVRAKFKVIEIREAEGSKAVLDADGQYVKDEHGRTRYEPTVLKTIAMSPVYANNDPNHENTKFWQASPSGKIELGTINEAAAAQFKLGKEYYVDFTEAGD